MRNTPIPEGKPDIVALLDSWGFETPNSARSGWVPVRCGFHDDRTRSAAVNADEGRFHCFACGVQGDAYDLVQHKDGTGFRDAVSILGAPIDSPGERRAKRRYTPPGRRGRK